MDTVPGSVSESKVLSQVTTANTPDWHGNPDWDRPLQRIFTARTAEMLRRLHVRAEAAQQRARIARTRQEREKHLRASKWACDRARALAMPRRALVQTCEGKTISVKCGRRNGAGVWIDGCGTTKVHVGCGQVQLCPTCAVRRAKKARRKIGESLKTHLAAAVATWGRDGARGPRPGVYLVTLTAPHTGDVGRDRDRLADAWREFQQWGRRHDVWGHYVAVWEATPGTRGDGHVHLHVAMISTWLPYEQMHREWRRAVDAEIAVMHISAPKREHLRTSAFNAAGYVAKYVSKGVQPSDMSGEKAGELLAASYGRRKLVTSVRFFVPLPCVCRECRGGFVVVQRPRGLDVERRPARTLASEVVLDVYQDEIPKRLESPF